MTEHDERTGPPLGARTGPEDKEDMVRGGETADEQVAAGPRPSGGIRPAPSEEEVQQDLPATPEASDEIQRTARRAEPGEPGE